MNDYCFYSMSGTLRLNSLLVHNGANKASRMNKMRRLFVTLLLGDYTGLQTKIKQNPADEKKFANETRKPNYPQTEKTLAHRYSQCDDGWQPLSERSEQSGL